MKTLRQVSLAALLVAATFNPAFAHNDYNNFRAVQWQCVDIPRLIRKGAANHQRFMIANVGYTPIFWSFMLLNPEGSAILGLSYEEGVSWGTLEGYSSHTISNSDLQTVRLTVAQEEPVALCFRDSEPSGYFQGYPSAREVRAISGHWVAFDLDNWWYEWGVFRNPGIDAASSSTPAIKRSARQHSN